MLKVAYNLGVDLAFEDVGMRKEALAPWLSGALKGSLGGALLGAGTGAAITEMDPDAVAVGAGLGALGGGLTGASLPLLRKLDAVKALEEKVEARKSLEAFLDALPG